MNKEDYCEYYIQGSDHYLIPKDVFDELFNEMNNWKQDTQKYKKVIDKTIKHVSSLSSKGRDCMIYADVKKDILNILKEVE